MPVFDCLSILEAVQSKRKLRRSQKFLQGFAEVVGAIDE